jgi:hypothetical protein
VPGKIRTSGGGSNNDASIEEIANSLCRTPSEIRQRIEEIAEVDAIGHPSLLHDGLTHRDRIAPRNLSRRPRRHGLDPRGRRGLRAAGSVLSDAYTSPEFTVEAEALVRGIYADATRNSMKQQRRFTKEFEEEAVRLVQTSGRT